MQTVLQKVYCAAINKKEKKTKEWGAHVFSQALSDMTTVAHHTLVLDSTALFWECQPWTVSRRWDAHWTHPSWWY